MASNGLSGRHVLIAGGGSGMGLALARQCLAAGARVLIVGRSRSRLDCARNQLGNQAALSTRETDITDERAVSALFDGVGPLDHIVSTAANMEGAYGALGDLEEAALHRAFASKVYGPWLLAKHGCPVLSPAGSITIVSGIAAYRPLPRGSIVAPANAALEGLVKALALELAPIRVNGVSPGWVDTTIWKDVMGDGKDEALRKMAARLPVGRIGEVDDIAEALMFVMTSGFTTGAILHCDGGQRLV